MSKIVGILNITPNSFSDGGLYNSTQSAVSHFAQLLQDGADIIDIGAQSTAYNAFILSPAQEIEILRPILSRVETNRASVDTFNVETAEFAIEQGVSVINDVKGGRNIKMLELLAAHPNVKYVSMFSLCIPARTDRRVKSFTEILEWMQNNINILKKYGLRDEQIILDPGLSFVTDADLSYELLRRAGELRQFGYPVFIGPSRKSFIGHVTGRPAQDRDPETMVIACHLARLEIDYIRVHNVGMVQRGMSIDGLLYSHQHTTN